MMRRFLPCLCLILFWASTSYAQTRDYPKFDFTAAYSLNHISAGTANQNLNGFTAAVGGNFRKWFALEGDVTYTTKSFGGTNRNLFTYLIGPRFTKRMKTVWGRLPTRLANLLAPTLNEDPSKRGNFLSKIVLLYKKK